MYAVETLSRYISRGVYTVSAPFHPFGGAVDIIVVQQQDGSFKSSPWYVKFGKFQGVLKTREKEVTISVNGKEADFHMYLDHTGEAFFIREVEGDEGGCFFSPPLSGDESDEQVESLEAGRLNKSQSLIIKSERSESITAIGMTNGRLAKRSNSTQSRIFSLFGRKSNKEGSKINEGDVDAQRINSLEQAEIAEDLLDIKWSTNLPTDDQIMGDTSQVSSSKTQSEKTDTDVHFSLEEGMESQDHVFAESNSSEITGTCNEVRDENHGSDDADLNFPDEIKGSSLPRVLTNEEILVNSTSSDLADGSEVMIQHSKWEATVGCDETRLFSTSETLVIDIRNSDSVMLKEGTSTGLSLLPNEVVNLSSRGDMLVETHDIKGINVDEAIKENGVSSNIYSEALASSAGGVELSDLNLKIPDLHGHGLKEVSVQSDALPKATELITGLNSYLETKSLNSRGSARNDNDCSIYIHPGDDHRNGENAKNSTIKGNDAISSLEDVGQQFTNSCSSCSMILSTADPNETKLVEVAHQDTKIERLNSEEISTVKLEDDFKNVSQVAELSSSHVICINGMSSENAFILHTGIEQSINTNESEAMCTVPQQRNSISNAKEGNAQHSGANVHQIHVSSEITIGHREYANKLSPDIAVKPIITGRSEEDQLLFGDIDNLVATEFQVEKPISQAVEEAANNLIGAVDECIEGNHDSPWSSNRSFGFGSFSTAASNASELVQDSSPRGSESFHRELRNLANPISIPKGSLGADSLGEAVGSAPSICGHIYDLERSDANQLLSRSLDSSPENFNWGIHEQELLTNLKAEVASESNSKKDLIVTESATAVVNSKSSGTLSHSFTNPNVEISLCRHLLFEGMGANAASHAFDSEKIDFEKFIALGPSLVKNERLVVRIGGQYFPWDTAASHILGLVAFGRGHTFQPESMIPVDKVETEGEVSRTIVHSGGSWRLWPFKFGMKKTVSSVHSAPDGTIVTDVGSISEQINNNAGDNYNMNERGNTKKVLRSLVPTSRQLASLNLKEGQNLVTFTFSTSMLGKQQVDARIYLWKWNTRIVISDVDGTITKSDVLGQFMPLVGKDWSHLGVAHLFSAIKENGYQLLFLSARAISQAYLTRQFLFNLKQDGKALPDGPVVISPDGLVPSLFREVIRRAPHEFKIGCLENIKALFPVDCNPFYAGFGNRDTDEISYLKVGIPKGKIFIINPKGEVAVNRWVNTRSYTSLHALVNGIFPAMSSVEQEDYNSWNYWKIPLPDISDN